MQLLTVIPIVKALGHETLSYFTAKPVSVGAIITVPLRNKKVSALVISTEPVSEAKAELRRLNFEIRKVSSIKTNSSLSKYLLEAAEKTARFHAVGIGSVLSVVLPEIILKQLMKKTKKRPALKTISNKKERFALQADDEERFSHYRTLIREEFARKASVLLCLPSIQEAETIFSSIEKGISDYTFIIHSSIPEKELSKRIDDISSQDHPVLIITTGYFLTIPRNDIGTIIIEHENSRAYQISKRPEIDLRYFALKLAESIGARFVVGDILLRTETIWQVKQGQFIEYAPLKFRSLTSAVSTIIPMKGSETKSNPELAVLSQELISLVRKTITLRKRLFIFATRQGLFPQTICADCGTTVICDNCGAPVVVHENPGGNLFICHRCGKRRSTDELCRYCQGWRLKPLGIGIDRVEKELKRLFEKIPIFVIGKNRTKNHKQAVETVKKFNATDGSILIGTEMALPYITSGVSYSAIASIDTLLSIPDFRIEERIIQIILKIRSISAETFLLQTRHPDKKIFDYALKGNLVDFYREEIDLRNEFGYPPFSILIKISVLGNRERATKLMKDFEDEFKKYSPVIFPSFGIIDPRKYLMHALIRLPKEGWIDNELLEKLRQLPLSYKVSVNPESLL